MTDNAVVIGHRLMHILQAFPDICMAVETYLCNVIILQQKSISGLMGIMAVDAAVFVNGVVNIAFADKFLKFGMTVKTKIFAGFNQAEIMFAGRTVVGTGNMACRARIGGCRAVHKFFFAHFGVTFFTAAFFGKYVARAEHKNEKTEYS